MRSQQGQARISDLDLCLDMYVFSFQQILLREASKQHRQVIAAALFTDIILTSLIC